MANEKASEWRSNEHKEEKKDVLGYVEEGLEARRSMDLAKTISNIGCYRYPVDNERSQQLAKKAAFEKAVDDTVSFCASDSQLKKYSITENEIMDWCKIPVMESNSSNSDVFANMQNKSFQQPVSADIQPEQAAEVLFALNAGLAKIGISNSFMQNCLMTVNRRVADSFSDRLLGLPKPSASESSLVTLEFSLDGSTVKMTYDSTQPEFVRLWAFGGTLDRMDDSRRRNTFLGMAKLGSDFKVENFSQPGRVFPVKKLNEFLELVQLANKNAMN
jgi:hypothetical protein